LAGGIIRVQYTAESSMANGRVNFILSIIKSIYYEIKSVAIDCCVSFGTLLFITEEQVDIPIAVAITSESTTATPVVILIEEEEEIVIADVFNGNGFANIVSAKLILIFTDFLSVFRSMFDSLSNNSWYYCL
jgi:hypothetical protein